MLGNMQAESGLHANIAQRGMTKLSDAQYTAAADNGLLDFARDSVGYGLCQWTYPARKAALLAFAREKGVSVGDEAMQVKYCLAELTTGGGEYTDLWRQLCSSHDLFALTQAVCTKYERPAHNNVGTRYEYALAFAELAARAFDGEDEDETPAADACTIVQPSVMLLQLAMQQDGYWPDKADGIKSEAFRVAFDEYASDVLKC